MRLQLRRHPVEAPPPGVIATARVDLRTRELARRLRPGEIAVIDHVDLDRGAAEALLAARPAAVVNAAPCISGRFPALGARAIVSAGVPLLDDLGRDLLAVVSDGDAVRLDGDVLYVREQMQVVGTRQSPDSVERSMSAARTGLEVQLEAVTATATELLRREHALLLDGSGAPELRTAVAGRPVVVVAEGPTAAEQLGSLRRFIRERRPVLVGVETGADVLLAAGLTPDVVVGDFDRVSDPALQRAGELVLHTRHSVRPMGAQRAERLVVALTPFPYAGRSEDAALLLADLAGASVVVLAGGSDGLVAALDAGRTAMASTFLTRLQVGGRLVSAPSAAALHRSRTPGRLLAALLACQLLGLGAAVAVTGGPASAWQDLRELTGDGTRAVADLVPGAR